MTVRAKTLLVIGITLIGLISLLFAVSNAILLSSLQQLERAQTLRELRHIRMAIQEDQTNLQNLAGAWAILDDTCDFVDNPRGHAAPVNTSLASLANNELDLIAYCDTRGKLIYSRAFDRQRWKDQPASKSFANHLAEHGTQMLATSPPGHSGIILLSDGPLLLAAYPIISETPRKRTHGTLFLGRFLTKVHLNRLVGPTQLNHEMRLFDDPALPDYFASAMVAISNGNTFFTHPITDSSIAGYIGLRDFDGAPALIIRVLFPRDLYNQGVNGMRYFLLSLLAVGGVFSVMVILLLERIVLLPLKRLSANVSGIGASGNLSARLAEAGKDELARLAGTVNGMLASLESSQEELRAKEALRKSEERYRNLVELSPDAVFIMHEGQFVFTNAAGLALIGAQHADEILGQPLQSVIHPDHREMFTRRISHFAPGQEWPLMEEQFLRHDGSVADVEITAVPFIYQDSTATQIVARDITDRKRDRERLNYLAYYDELTGLPNRTLFNDRLAQALAVSNRRKEQVAVMVLDLDRFKEVNDTLGHYVGDRLLQVISTRLKSCLRESDTVARIGGDEYFIILPNIGNTQCAEVVAHKILNALAEPLMIDSHDLYISASLGISTYPIDGANVEALVKNADTAMYRAKAEGRNDFKCYSHEMGLVASERRTLENKLRKAIEREELQVHYQPQVDLTTGRVVGMEALARWTDPELGIVAPLLFIPLAEETGLIEPLGEWVLRTACAQNRLYQLAGYPDLRIAVNLSPRQFLQQDLVDTVMRVLQETDLPAETLELEITESTAMQNIDHTLSVLHSLYQLGVRIAIDDFGTGYSSFSYLTKFPIHTLKIDRSFIQDLMEDPDDASIVAAIIAMTHSLRRRVIAEAVETEEQLAFLHAHHCDEAQGYYFGKPVPHDQLLSELIRIEEKTGVHAQHR